MHDMFLLLEEHRQIQVWVFAIERSVSKFTQFGVHLATENNVFYLQLKRSFYISPCQMFYVFSAFVSSLPSADPNATTSQTLPGTTIRSRESFLSEVVDARVKCLMHS